jgi:hypothetical protein
MSCSPPEAQIRAASKQGWQPGANAMTADADALHGDLRFAG